MKKTFLLLLSACLLLAACNNQSSTTATESTETVAPAEETAEQPAAADTLQAVDEGAKEDGTAAMPAQVIEDLTAMPVSGATVVATEAEKSVETVMTDTKGNYKFTKLVSGHTYSFAVSKKGFVSQTKTAAYDGSSATLPWFSLAK